MKTQIPGNKAAQDSALEHAMTAVRNGWIDWCYDYLDRLGGERTDFDHNSPALTGARDILNLPPGTPANMAARTETGAGKSPERPVPQLKLL